MGDQEFNFPPTERREPRQFEPPPWERDAFDKTTRSQAAETEPPAAEDVGAEAPADAGAVAAEPAAEEVPATPVAGDTVAATGDQPGVSEAQLTEMLAGLRAEEPTSMQSYGPVAIALSVFTGLVGVVLLVWAMAMFVSATARGTGRVGVISGSIVAFFGALFIGLSVWVAVRTLRQRGVL